MDTFTGAAGTNITAHTSDSGGTWVGNGGTATNLALSPGGVTGTTGNGAYSTSLPATPTADLWVQLGSAPNLTTGEGFVSTDCDTNNTVWSALQLTSRQVNVAQLGGGNPSYTATVYNAAQIPATLAIRRKYVGGQSILTAFFAGNPVAKVIAATPNPRTGRTQIASQTGWTFGPVTGAYANPTAGFCVVCAGDSLTWGGGLAGEIGGTTLNSQSYPAQLQTLVGGPTSREVSNIGYPGWTSSQLIVNDAKQLCNDPTMIDQIVVLLIGINDLNTGVANATLLSNIAAYVSAVTTAGYKCIVGTICHIGPAASASYATVNANADTVNTTIRSTYATGSTRVADFAANALLQDYANTVYRNTDQLHYLGPGYALMAGIVNATLF